MGAAIIIALCAIFGVGSYFVTKKADNPIEQVAERIMESELGLPKDSIDLTPEKK
jgi:hypothetical protein